LWLSIPTSKRFGIKMRTKTSPDLFGSAILTVKKDLACSNLNPAVNYKSNFPSLLGK
jgi:hypothetical protein